MVPCLTYSSVLWFQSVNMQRNAVSGETKAIFIKCGTNGIISQTPSIKILITTTKYGNRLPGVALLFTSIGLQLPVKLRESKDYFQEIAGYWKLRGIPIQTCTKCFLLTGSHK